MRRLFLRIAHNHNIDKKNLESISQKPFFKHYQSGIALSIQNKLEEANEQFKKSLEEIKKSKQHELQHYSYILRRVANNHRRMGQMKLAQEKFYDIIKHKRQCGVNPMTIYDDYDRLYRHMISYDLEKAVKLCKALLLKQKEDMPILHIKLFHFNLANAYLLLGNYNDAKSRYSKCLQMDPQGKLRAYTYNNLGLTCWWHKNPLEKIRDQSQSVDKQRIQKDFNQAKQLFAKSITLAENLKKNQINQSRQMMIAQAFDFKKGILHDKLEFQSPESLFALYNLAQYYIINDPLQKVQILFWLNKALNLSQRTKNQKFFDRIYVEHSLLTNNIESLIEELPALIHKNRSSQRFEEEVYFCSVMARLIAQKDQSQAQQYIARAQTIRNVLPPWIYKLKYLAYDGADDFHN